MALRQGDVGEYVRALLASERLGGQVRHHRCLPVKEAEYGQCRLPWPQAVEKALRGRGLEKGSGSLYSHQAAATDLIRSGRSIVVATPTASGKSLIYSLPVLADFLRDPDARALYLFPLKALAQDQAMAFQSLTEAWPKEARPSIALYDGDTSDYARRKIRRQPPAVLISNPEMLHLGILPHHEQWAPFLAGLSHIVVDEAHVYRGVFGAHMAGVFRRLSRLAARYGADPTFIFCTATVGNPGELASALSGLPLPGDGDANGRAPVVLDRSGAPQGARHYIFLEPPQSPASAAIDLLKAAVARGLRTIVYCRSRRMTELVSLWAGAVEGPLAGRISAYRAGFLPEERREIEARMASGDLLAVISTSALELGIDIGGLDVCILVGYPGTVTATLQRGGRVGRALRESVVVLVAGDDALDQYFLRHPDDFFSRPPELAVVNPDNATILARHLECAAAEQPLREGEPWLHDRSVREALKELERNGDLLRSADGTQWLASRKRPQRHVDLRGAGRSLVIEDTEGSIIGSIDSFRAWRETHQGAVYLHRGRTYVIEELDTERGCVKARPAKVSYFTRTRGSKSTEILEEQARQAVGRAVVCFGCLRITDRVTGYERRSTSGNRLLTIVPLDAPPHVFETEGLWYVFPDSCRERMEEQFLHFMGSLHAVEHAAIGMLPLEVMADRNDFGGISTPLHPQAGHACVFIYDALPGGAGLAREAFSRARDLLTITRDAILSCPCEDGCPSCVHSPKCGSGNRPISKAGAVALLQDVLSDTEDSEGKVFASELSFSPAASDNGFFLPAEKNEKTVFPVEHVTNGGQNMFPVEHSKENVAESVGRYIVFDVETRRSAAEVGGWHLASKMGVSILVAYDSLTQSCSSYTQDNLAAFFSLLREADVVVGFNSLRFDCAVLQPFAPYNLATLSHVDLLRRIKDTLHYRVSLDNVAQATLGAPKSADGLQALQWWKEGRLDKIEAYCRDDVLLTQRLYCFGLEHGFVLFRNKAGQRVRVPVNFSNGESPCLQAQHS